MDQYGSGPTWSGGGGDGGSSSDGDNGGGNGSGFLCSGSGSGNGSGSGSGNGSDDVHAGPRLGSVITLDPACDWIPRSVWPLYYESDTMDKPISEGRKTIERSLRGLPLLTVFSEEWARLDWNYTTMKYVSCEGKATHRAAGTTSAVCAITGAGEIYIL